jgi:hypothetical protein
MREAKDMRFQVSLRLCCTERWHSCIGRNEDAKLCNIVRHYLLIFPFTWLVLIPRLRWSSIFSGGNLWRRVSCCFDCLYGDEDGLSHWQGLQFTSFSIFELGAPVIVIAENHHWLWAPVTSQNARSVAYDPSVYWYLLPVPQYVI